MDDNIKIHVMKCGEVGVDPAVPTRDVSGNPLAYTGLFRSARRRIWMPVFTYLIRHPQGNVLVDTGWSRKVRTDPVKTLSPHLHFVSRPRLPAGTSVDEQIAEIGLSPEQLDYVILTHMDVDHINGIQMVRGARHIMASREEIRRSRTSDLRYWDRQWAGISIEEIPFQESADGSGEKVFDIFGDGTVRVLLRPGHSAGLSVVLVENGGKSVLITGDAGYAKTSWRDGRLPGPVYDRQKTLDTLRWIRGMEEDGCTILASHDPEIRQQVMEL